MEGAGFDTVTATGSWSDGGASPIPTFMVKVYPGTAPADETRAALCGRWDVALTSGNATATRSCTIYLEAGQSYVVRASEVENRHTTTQSMSLQLSSN